MLDDARRLGGGHQRVEIGALVTCNSYRNPELLADMARTVDHICGGRLILGIGAGWFERDYDEYGYDFGTPGARLADLGRGAAAHHGRWAKLNPAPTRDIPILIGGGGERKTLRTTARHAEIWHGFGDPGDAGAQERRSSTSGAPVEGRDPAEIERSTAASTAARDDRAEACSTPAPRLFTVGLGGPRLRPGRLARLDRLAGRSTERPR